MKPIPVKAAADIAREYDKRVVCVIALGADNRIYTATYGVEPDDKITAAALGEMFTLRAGGDLSRVDMFEDLPEYLKKKSHDV